MQTNLKQKNIMQNTSFFAAFAYLLGNLSSFTFLIITFMVFILPSALSMPNITGESPTQIIILNIQYKDGDYSFLSSIVSTGYAPDEVPSDFYFSAVLKDSQGLELSRTYFKDPSILFSDFTQNGEFKGGAVKLSEATFALTIPYSNEAEVLEIYNSTGGSILSHRLKSNNLLWIVLAAVLVITFVLILIMIIRKISDSSTG